MTGYIYALIDPITDHIKYVGQTRINVKTRAQQHWRDRNQPKHTNNWCAKWLRRLERDKVGKPKVLTLEVLEDTNTQELNEKEKYWIAQYRTPFLTNTSGKDYFYVHKKNHNSTSKKKVYAYNKEYEMVEFESAREASRITGVSYKVISSFMKGKYYNTDYVFSLSELSKEEIDEKFKGKVLRGQFESIDVTTGERHVFSSQVEAALFFNIDFRNISRVLRGDRSKAYNKYWRMIN